MALTGRAVLLALLGLLPVLAAPSLTTGLLTAAVLGSTRWSTDTGAMAFGRKTAAAVTHDCTVAVPMVYCMGIVVRYSVRAGSTAVCVGTPAVTIHAYSVTTCQPLAVISA